MRYCKENFVITITCKDGKFRAKVENPTFDYDEYLATGTFNGHQKKQLYYSHVIFPGKKIEGYTERVNAGRAKRYANVLSKMIEYIEKEIKDDDF